LLRLNQGGDFALQFTPQKRPNPVGTMLSIWHTLRTLDRAVAL
jgi:hypothetical protein